MNTLINKEVDDMNIIDKASEIEASSALTGVEAHDVSTSNANDNDENGGVPTPPLSSDVVTIEGEATVISSTPIVDEEQVMAECVKLTNEVALAANSCQRSKFSADLTKIPEDLHSLVIPDDSNDLSVFVVASERAIQAAKESSRIKRKTTTQEYHVRHEHAREFGFIALDTALKLSLRLNEVACHGGGRSDLHPEKYEGDNRFQYQIFEEDFGLHDKVARRIMKLTVEAVDKEKKFANDNNEIPTLTHALRYVKAKEKELNKAKEAANNIASNYNGDSETIELPVAKYDIIYADFNKFEEGFDLSEAANDNCLLYLWADKDQIAHAIDFMHNNGFDYADAAVFVRNKFRHGGQYFKDYHSQVLVGSKGNFEKPEFRSEKSVAYESEIGEGSGYTYYRNVINLLYPDAEMLDLVTEAEVLTETIEDNEGVDDTSSTSREVSDD